MNNPTNMPIDIEEQRSWLVRHKADTGLPWPAISKPAGIPKGTISNFAGDTYEGNNQNIAEIIFRYRQVLTTRAEIDVEAPDLPGYFETPTSRRVNAILNYAMARSRIGVVATESGLGKTTTLENFRASATPVWLATMAPSSAGVNNMQIAILESMGETDAKGTPQALSRRIKDRVRASGGLLILDEAQFLSEKSLEELRTIHDDAMKRALIDGTRGVGICLVGNTDVLLRLELGRQKDAFARLASRVAQRVIAYHAVEGDVLALADAWRIQDEDMRRFLLGLRQVPGSLRTLTFMLESAWMLASGDGKPLSLSYLQEGWALQSQRQLAA